MELLQPSLRPADWYNQCAHGDCRSVLQRMIADEVKVQCIVTSPPYFGLRDYNVPGQIGLETNPDKYVATMVDVFRLCRELLHDNGVMWLNLGDSYTGSGKGGGGKNTNCFRGGPGSSQKKSAITGRPRAIPGLPHKSLIGIPWRVALALQADGWILRQDIIWYKPNALPESMKDRCTKAHEYLFMFIKKGRYYFNADQIKEPIAASTKARLDQDIESQAGSMRTHAGEKSNGPMKACGGDGGMRNKRSVWSIPTESTKTEHFAKMPLKLAKTCILASSRAGDVVLDPFFGSGTTGEAAQSLGRHWIGCELNHEYMPLQEDRVRQMGLALG